MCALGGDGADRQAQESGPFHTRVAAFLECHFYSRTHTLSRAQCANKHRTLPSPPSPLTCTQCAKPSTMGTLNLKSTSATRSAFFSLNTCE